MSMSKKEMIVVMDPDNLSDIIKDVVEKVVIKTVPKIVKKVSEKDYLSKEEVLSLLDCSSSKLQYLRTSKQIPYVKNGRSIVYPREGIEKFMEEHRVD